jgi:DNA invertase Pin-like site-specific DNA recombinase
VAELSNKRVAIYARFSSDKQNDASIEDQVHRAREWLRSHGGDPDVAQIFPDFAISGASMDRPGMRSLMYAVESGAIDLIVTESVDRISRDAHDAFGFRKALAYRNVALECLDGTRVASDDKNGLLMYGLRSMLGEQYLIDLADKTRRGLEGRARAGFATGSVPFGYRTERTPSGNKIDIDDECAAIVREVFGLYATGMSMEAAARQLNTLSRLSPRGRAWTVGAVRCILTNPAYHGKWTFGAREWRKVPGTNKRRPRKSKTRPITQDRPHLAIVSDELWKAVASRFATHKKLPKAKRAHLLSGILKCGVCGSAMHDAGGSSHRYLKCSLAKRGGQCSNKVTLRSIEADQAFVNKLASQAREVWPELLDLAREEITVWSSSRGFREQEVTAELAKTEREITKLVAAIVRTGSEALEAELTKAEARKRSLQDQLAQLKAAAPELPPPEVISETIATMQSLHELPLDAARELLRNYLHERVIHAVPEADRYLLSWGLLGSAMLASSPIKNAAPGDNRG